MTISPKKTKSKYGKSKKFLYNHKIKADPNPNKENNFLTFGTSF
jgi:hypothetical protein